jgi:hypothetical protein
LVSPSVTAARRAACWRSRWLGTSGHGGRRHTCDPKADEGCEAQAQVSTTADITREHRQAILDALSNALNVTRRELELLAGDFAVSHVLCQQQRRSYGEDLCVGR